MRMHCCGHLMVPFCFVCKTVTCSLQTRPDVSLHGSMKCSSAPCKQCCANRLGVCHVVAPLTVACVSANQLASMHQRHWLACGQGRARPLLLRPARSSAHPYASRPPHLLLLGWQQGPQMTFINILHVLEEALDDAWTSSLQKMHSPWTCLEGIAQPRGGMLGLLLAAVCVKVSMDNHDTSTCPALCGLTPAARDSKERNHEYGLLGACLYMMMQV